MVEILIYLLPPVLLATGMLIILAAIRAREATLYNRIRSYRVGNCRRQGSSELLSVVVGELLRSSRRALRVFGSTDASITRRLRFAGETPDPGRLRLQQLTGGFIGVACAVVPAVASRAPQLTILLVSFGAVAGALAPDLMLTVRANTRQRHLETQVPDFAELLSLAVSGGDSLDSALRRICSTCIDPIGFEIRQLLAAVDSGTPLVVALLQAGRQVQSASFIRLTDTLSNAGRLGTPLAGVLREQAIDIRTSQRKELMEQAGKREIAMMVPVVFGILPLTVLFVLYPSLRAMQMNF